jgi:rSAM/selenodomain-associated transferase 2
MALSIIIPCLNEADGIASALEALQPFRRRGAEVIVVDGGSGDDTIARARAGADHVLTAPCGRAIQMNAGAAHARGEILLFLHADCTMPDAADGLIIDSLRRERRSWGRFDVRIRGRSRLLRAVAALMNARSRITGIATGDQGMFVTRSLFDAVGHFPEIALMEDIELSRRLKRYGRPLCLRHHVSVSARRWETHGVLRTILLMWKLRLAYWLGADPDRLALQYAAHKR